MIWCRSLILNTILGIVQELGDQYRVRPDLGGMVAYAPKAMAVVCIMMEAERKTYHKMVGHLRSNRDIAMKAIVTRKNSCRA